MIKYTDSQKIVALEGWCGKYVLGIFATVSISVTWQKFAQE